jgi:chromosomal replication initiation ATPase DnaA
MINLDLLARELSTTAVELRKRCRTRDIVQKRWVIMCCYRMMGFSLQKIGVQLGLDHQTVLYGIDRADETVREKARELYQKFTNKEPDCKLLPKKTKMIKIPNYHTGEIIVKEVEI